MKREQELKEKLSAAQRDSQEKDQKCSKLEDDMYDMQKKMVASRDDYEQQQQEKRYNIDALSISTCIGTVTSKM